MPEVSTNRKGGARKILIVDDTESVAELMREMIRSFGHEPEICGSADDALAQFVPDKFDLIITDYLMPRTNGVDFARVIRQKSPAQRILLITGSTFPMTEATAKSLPVDAMLQKPFSVEEFHQAVNDIFTAPATA